MSIVKNTTAATLRRRARTLSDAGYNPQFIACLMRAADELEVYERVIKDPEQAALDAFADNRRLRTAMVEMFHVIAQFKGKNHPAGDRIRKVLNAIRPPGEGYTLITVQVPDGAERAAVEDKLRELLDDTFTPKVEQEA